MSEEPPVVYARDGRIGRVRLRNMTLASTQTLATIHDGITRQSPEGINFTRRAEAVGWKQAVRECDAGTWDRTEDRPVNPEA